ncbi:solute carrier family 2 member 11, like isoform X2 [Mugil cephalus]|nr:solute carrier family 2 member 11, like isoform X2 [Mugil cephalus]
MTSPSAFIKELMNQTCVHRYNVSLEQWQVSLIWSFTVSIFCIGGLLGSLFAGSLMSKFGRKQCLLLNNFVAIAGAVLMLLSQKTMSFEMVMVGRLLYGINSGVGLTVHSVYLTECAPKRLRGMVGVTIATFISTGKFFGQLLGISELLGTEKMWPWLLGFNGFTALFQLFTLPFLPESPSFLLLDRGDRQACEKALHRLWGDKDYSREVEEMLEERASLGSVRSHSVLELIQNRTVRWQLLTIVVVFTTVQLCGINAVYFYSFDVFRAAGIPEEKLRFAALGTGLCELCTSLACFVIIESTGKRVLLFRGYMGMSATLILLTVTLYLQGQVSWMPYCSMALIFIFIFFFASGPAGVTAPLPGEIFNQSYKSAAYIVACTLNWTGLFTLGMLFPVLVVSVLLSPQFFLLTEGYLKEQLLKKSVKMCHSLTNCFQMLCFQEQLDYYCFLIFLVFCAVCGIYVRLNVPETKNRTVLEITAEFERMHSKTAASDMKRSTEQKLNGIQIHETKL